MPTKRLMGFMLGVLLLWEGAKGIPKAAALRHAREDTGLKQDAWLAAAQVL